MTSAPLPSPLSRGTTPSCPHGSCQGLSSQPAEGEDVLPCLRSAWSCWLAPGAGQHPQHNPFNGTCFGEAVPDCHTTKLGVLPIQWTGGSEACRQSRTIDLATSTPLGFDLPRSIQRLVNGSEVSPMAGGLTICLPGNNSFPHEREPQHQLLFQELIGLSWMRNLWNLDTRPT